MRRIFLPLWTASICLSLVSMAHAGWPGFWHSGHVDQHRNNCWPQPFRAMDATSVMAPFDVMRDNGWRSYNTLGDTFFNDRNGLTEAGQLRLKWIITQAPESRRVVFVYKGDTGETTASRVESVQTVVSQWMPSGSLPNIFVTDVEPTSSTGQYQTDVNRAMNRSTPNPRLPAFNGINTPSSNSGSGSGSSSGASK